MKRSIIIIILIIGIFFIPKIEVIAKDSIFSINKYQEEDLKFIKESYNQEKNEIRKEKHKFICFLRNKFTQKADYRQTCGNNTVFNK